MTNFSYSPHLGKIQDANKSSVNAIGSLESIGTKGFTGVHIVSYALEPVCA